MESDISDDDIDALLKETGFRSTPALQTLHPPKEESLEKLLEELMSTAPPSPVAPSPLPIQKEKHKRSRLPLLPIWFSMVILVVFLVGGALGFFWGNTRTINQEHPSLTRIDTQLSTLVEEIHKLSQWVNPPNPPREEIIEPLSPTSDIQKLAPEATL